MKNEKTSLKQAKTSENNKIALLSYQVRKTARVFKI